MPLEAQITVLMGTFVCFAILLTFSDGGHDCLMLIFVIYYHNDMVGRVLILQNALLGSRENFHIMKYIDGVEMEAVRAAIF